MAVLFDRKSPPELIAKALPTLGITGVLPANDLLGFLEHDSPEVRAACLDALAGRQPVPSTARQAIVERLKDPSPEVRKVAITIASAQKFREAIPALIELSGKEATRTEATAALTVMPDPRALPVYLDAINSRDAEVRRAGEAALLSIRDLVAGELEKKARTGSLSAPALEVIDRVLTRFVPVASWKVIGPYPRTTAQVFFGDKTIDFGRSHVGAEGRSIAWIDRTAQPETGRVVLDDFKGGAGDRGGFGYDTNGSPDLAAFAVAEIDSDRDRPALLLFGSSGSLVAMLNGNWILDYNNFAGRPYQADANRVRVALKKGKNRLILRTRQGIGSWSFGVQISEPSESLFATRPGTVSLEELKKFARANTGNPAKGRALFLDPRGIGCVKCHAAAGQGSATVGPDLTGLALKYDREEIIRSVLEPSSRIATGYQPVLVAKADGSVVTGLLRSETDGFIDLIDANAKTTAREQIRDRREAIGGRFGDAGWPRGYTFQAGVRRLDRVPDEPEGGEIGIWPGSLAMTDVAIVGASGYAALELIRILLRHPAARIAIATSRADESPRLDAIHPSLAGRTDLNCTAFDAQKIADRCQFAFLGLPHAASLAVTPELRRRGVRVIDLIADYRLKDAKIYADYYEHEHSDAAGLREAVYGLPELFRDRIRSANLIANPGCYTSASILALAPLLAGRRIERSSIIIDAKSGISGAGRSPKPNLHFPECNENFSAYGVGRHRHKPEIDQVLSEVAEGRVEVLFTPHLVPMDRGIFATIYATPTGEIPSQQELLEIFRGFYHGSPFVRVVDRLPSTKDSSHTNFCDITARVVQGRIVILACLDNLLKGAAGVAVQNFNLMTGCPETTALL